MRCGSQGLSQRVATERGGRLASRALAASRAAQHRQPQPQGE